MIRNTAEYTDDVDTYMFRPMEGGVVVITCNGLSDVALSAVEVQELATWLRDLAEPF